LRAFPLQSTTRQGCPPSPLLFNIALEVLGTASRQQKEIKGIQNSKERVKFLLLADNMTLYIENPEDSTKKILELINEFRKVTGYKINVQKSVAFLYSNNEVAEREIKKTIPFTITPKIITYLEINIINEMKDPYSETIKHQWKKVKMTQRNGKNPCSWITTTQSNLHI